MRKIVFILAMGLAPFHSCTTSHKMGDNQKKSGHYRLYSYPTKMAQTKENQRFKKVMLVSSNDFQGEIFPTVIPIPNRFNENRVLKYGGVAATRAYLDIFHKTFPGKVLYVDSGSFLSQNKNHRQTIFLYNYLKVDVASIGLGEFTLNLPPRYELKNYLQSLLSDANFDVINSNLFDLEQAEQMKINGLNEYSIKEINGLKVGFIGVLTSNLSQKIPDKKINGLYIQNPVKNVIVKSTLLRRQGAHIIVLLANEGIDCTSQMAHTLEINELKVNFDPTESGHCDTYKNDFHKLLEQLPPQTIDLAITGGKDSKVANFIKNVPVIQNPGKGKFLSWAELYYDTKHNTVVQNMTKIHQPIKLCHHFFKGTQDCFEEGNLKDEEIISAQFLGQPINIKDMPRSVPALE